MGTCKKQARIIFNRTFEINLGGVVYKTIEYYLSKGFNKKTAEYYANGRRKIVAVKANDNFTLTITFDNGENRIYDVKPLLKKGTVFEKFLNINVFRRVYIDKQHCISWDINPDINSDMVWNNKVDLCPDSCYIDSIPITQKFV